MSPDDPLDIPDFLIRPRSSSSEPPKEPLMASTSTETGKAKPSAPKAKAVKAAPKAAPKPKATPKGEAKRKASGKVDAYGFRDGSLKSKAAAMYAAKKGATLSEVKEALGSVQLNVITELEGRGFTVTRTKEDGDGKREVTRYKLTK